MGKGKVSLPMNFLKHIWYCWFRGCYYLSPEDSRVLALFSKGYYFDVLHFDGKNNYLKRRTKRGRR